MGTLTEDNLHFFLFNSYHYLRLKYNFKKTPLMCTLQIIKLESIHNEIEYL